MHSCCSTDRDCRRFTLVSAPPDGRWARRVHPDAALPAPLVTRTVVALDEFTAGKWGGDIGAVQLVVAPLAADRRFRTVRDPQVFTAVLRAIPAYAACWT
jgi:hypothetical protein